MKTVIMIGGPTAIGKSSLALDLARELDAVILSADSRQIYREMNIGTAKPSLQELNEVPHLFVNHRSIHENYSVGQFEQECIATIEELVGQGRSIIICGGTGLYMRAILKGLDEFPEIPKTVKDQVEGRLLSGGIGALQDWIDELDPVYAEMVDRNNPHRLIRAISVCLVAGKPYSSFLSNPRARRSFDVFPLFLEAPRDWLYTRIDQRVLDMVAHGLFEEATALFPLRNHAALQTVGYAEIFDYLDGIITREEAIGLIQRNTRRYAKRQVTWFNKEEWWHRIDVLPKDTLTERVMAILKDPSLVNL
jgi:tRNA dimethylallyltransferase